MLTRERDVGPNTKINKDLAELMECSNMFFETLEHRGSDDISAYYVTRIEKSCNASNSTPWQVPSNSGEIDLDHESALENN
jgi:hypothetical protein